MSSPSNMPQMKARRRLYFPVDAVINPKKTPSGATVTTSAISFALHSNVPPHSCVTKNAERSTFTSLSESSAVDTKKS